MPYKLLTREQRYTIELERKEGTSVSEISQKIGVHRSTVYRELKRNSILSDQYYYEEAEALSHQRRPRSWFKSHDWDEVESLLREDFSPEQVRGTLLKKGKDSPSVETIYQHIQIDKERGGTLYQHLRHHPKPYRKRGAQKDKRGQIKERIDISDRPEIVKEKTRLGDWEADTIIGSPGGKVLVTLVERLSRYTLVALAENKTAEAVNATIYKLLKEYQDKVHTITYDNGKEFAHHYLINERLNAQSYFATPYHSWERGLNENTNGLIRQYFPKKSSFDHLSNQEVQAVQDKLNSRPRKCLEFETPNALFLPS